MERNLLALFSILAFSDMVILMIMKIISMNSFNNNDNDLLIVKSRKSTNPLGFND